MNEFVIYQSEEKYAIITIINGKANAINHQVLEGLNSSLDTAEKENKVVILTGQSGIFSAGFDLKIMTKSPESAKELVTKGSALSLRMLSFSAYYHCMFRACDCQRGFFIIVIGL